MKTSRLKNFPVSLFSSVMGLTGFAISLQKITEASYLPEWVSQYALALSTLTFAVLLVVYVSKTLVYPLAVKTELEHPVKRKFSTGYIYKLPASIYSLYSYQYVRFILAVDRWRGNPTRAKYYYH